MVSWAVLAGCACQLCASHVTEAFQLRDRRFRYESKREVTPILRSPTHVGLLAAAADSVGHHSSEGRTDVGLDRLPSSDLETLNSRARITYGRARPHYESTTTDTIRTRASHLQTHHTHGCCSHRNRCLLGGGWTADGASHISSLPCSSSNFPILDSPLTSDLSYQASLRPPLTMRVLVIGGTGGVGSQLISQLAALPNPPTIRASSRLLATARFPAAVEAVTADLTDSSTFPALFAGGVHGVFCYAQGNGKYEELTAAAKAAGVQRMVLLSSVSVNDHPDSQIAKLHSNPEDAIRASGVHYTFIRAGFFNDNFHRFIDPQLVNGSGVVELPYPDAMIAPVAEEDLAAVALTALTTHALQDEAPVVSGPTAIDFNTEIQLISKVREAAGKQPLVVKKLDHDEWVKKYTGKLDMPASLVPMLANAWRELVGKQPDIQGSERLTGKPGTTAQQWVENRRDEWVKAGEKTSAA